MAATYPAQLPHAFEEADRLELLSGREVNDLLARSAGHPGLGRLAELVRDWHTPSDDAHNEFERRFLHLCIEEGLPEPAMNVSVCGFVVDALWPGAKLIVELDGYGFHGHRQAFERDRERDAILQLAGYRVIRVTWRRLERERTALVGVLRTMIDEPTGGQARGPTVRTLDAAPR